MCYENLNDSLFLFCYCIAMVSIFDYCISIYDFEAFCIELGDVYYQPLNWLVWHISLTKRIDFVNYAPGWEKQTGQGVTFALFLLLGSCGRAD